MGLKVERVCNDKSAGVPVSIICTKSGTAGRDMGGDLWVRMDCGAVCFAGTNMPLVYSTSELRGGDHKFVPDDSIEVTITIRE